MRTARSKPASAARRRAVEGPLTPQQQALRELLRVQGLHRRLAEPHFAKFGLSPAQWGVLRSLARLDQAGHPEPRMHELCAALLVQPPSLSATLDRMDRMGLIVRHADPIDHRTRRVGLTQAAWELLGSAQTTHHQWTLSLMSCLNASDLEQLTSLLAKLGAHFQLLADIPAAPPPQRPRRDKRSLS